MAETVTLARRAAFAGLLAPVGPNPAGVSAAERLDLALATVQTRKGQADALASRVFELHGVTPPRGPRRAVGEVEWLGIGRDRWLAIAPGGAAGFGDDLAAKLDGLASVIDQTDGLAVLAISGARARETFAKGLPIDLHPTAFSADAVAASLIGHVPTTIWRTADGDAFEVALARSFAGDFAHWLTLSAAEFGLDISLPAVVGRR
jgi:sarcosine oxidase subunit gamma